MMQNILLFPVPDWAGDLLGQGRMGADISRRPACIDHGLHCPEGRRACQARGRADSALVLAWSGEPVPEGVDRAQRVLAKAWLGKLMPWQRQPIEEMLCGGVVWAPDGDVYDSSWTLGLLPRMLPDRSGCAFGWEQRFWRGYHPDLRLSPDEVPREVCGALALARMCEFSAVAKCITGSGDQR